MADAPATPRRVLGIDPGLNTTGYALIEGTSASTPRILEAGVIRPTRGRETTDMAGRLKVLYDSLMEIIEEYRPNAMAVEQLFSHYEHPRTAILMGHARGVIMLAGGQFGLTVNSYAPTRVKKVITGSGRATKEQMQWTMLREFGLSAMPEPHDVADALSIALCDYHVGGRDADLDELPASA